ncbi:uncharacterized protein LOC144104999 [Amblyomma americanum]
MLQSDDSQVLFGFSEEIDWVPLRFVKPLPENIVCSACKCVPKRNCFLPCRCVLCEPCYEQCKARGGICALDGQVCLAGQEDWREVSAEKIMKKEVYCWNRENGCEVVGDVSTMINHFHTTCARHSTRCPKCAASVLRRDMIAHLQSGCSELVLSRVLPDHGSAIPRSELEVIKSALRDVKDALRNASREQDALRGTVAELAAVHQESLRTASTEENDLEEIKEGLCRAEEIITENARINEKRLAELAALKETTEQGIGKLALAVEELNLCRREEIDKEKSFQDDMAEKMTNLEEELRTLKEHLQGDKK